jgi:hypothetical protein
LDFFLRQIKPPDVQEKYMIEEKEATEHGVTLVDAPLLLDEGFGLFGSFTENYFVLLSINGAGKKHRPKHSAQAHQAKI